MQRMTENLDIREIKRNEHGLLGEFVVDAHANMDGFPSPVEQPAYYVRVQHLFDK